MQNPRIKTNNDRTIELTIDQQNELWFAIEARKQELENRIEISENEFESDAVANLRRKLTILEQLQSRLT